MKIRSIDQKGFTAFEAILVIVIVGLVVGVGYWVVKQRGSTTTSSTSSPAVTSARPGTVSAIDQLTSQDGQSEAAISSKNDPPTQTDATSTNSALNNLGGAYNESSF